MDKREIKVAPSLLAADFRSLKDEFEIINKLDIESLHLDIMDGQFVPNISFGPMIVKAVRALTDLHLNVHLMITSPVKYCADFVAAGADEIIFHKEVTSDPEWACAQIGAQIPVGIAFNPGTNSKDLEVLARIGDKLSMVLLMTVHPGFGGQEFISDELSTIESACELREMNGFKYDIAVDGGINSSTAPLAAKAGANVLVAGSSVFKYPNRDYSGAIDEIISFNLH